MIGLLLVASLSVACAPEEESAGEDAAPVCVGVAPPEGAADHAAGPLRELDEEGALVGPVREAPLESGQAAPPWTLADFQPQSCGEGSTYGMDSFEGHVTVVALLAAW